jgi:AraC family transcriptional regulator
LQYEGVNPEISAMWQSLTEDMISKLKRLSRIEPRGLLNASVNFTEGRAEGTELDQYIGVATHESASETWQTLSVPASTWGVFTARGKFPEQLQSVWGRIYSEWFPMSGYEVSEGPEILWNESKDTTPPDFHSEIWIPIVKK